MNTTNMIVPLIAVALTATLGLASKLPNSPTKDLLFVTVDNDEVVALLGGNAVLPCNYEPVQSGAPITVTWKVGSNPPTATKIAECSSFDVETGVCISTTGLYNSRYDISREMTSGKTFLTIPNLQEHDNGNFWCQVSASTNDEDYEYVTDAKSIVLRVRESTGERPKFSSVDLPATVIQARPAENATFDCSCSGYCDDVAWYKGPTVGDNYEYVYGRSVNWGGPSSDYYGENWKGRIIPNGFQLTILDVRPDDSGRYWCEGSEAGMYAHGDTANDAKSLVLLVDETS